MKNLVLTFHNVQDGVWFEQTLRLIGRVFAFGTLDQLYARLTGERHTPKRMCFLTFDDGERSVYEVVFPVLKRLHIPAAMFVSPKNIEEGGAFWFQRMRVLGLKEEERMKQKPLAEVLAYINAYDPKGESNIDENINSEMFSILQQSGLITFGAHTQHHPILSRETDAVSYAEIRDSVAGLEQLTGEKVRYFAYPNGSLRDFSEREKSTLRQCGVVMAFSTIPGYVVVKTTVAHSETDLLAIPRVGLSYGSRWHILLKLLFPKTFVRLRQWKGR